MMNNRNRELAQKYFNNTCTAEEAEKVLEWFDTPEGQSFLEEKMDSDVDDMEDADIDRIKYMVRDLDSEKMLQTIKERIKPERAPVKRYDLLTPMLKIAASVLVILTASLFYYSTSFMSGDEMAEPDPVHYASADDQQKQITLSDGTTIRLNGNSEIWLSTDFNGDNRELVLRGEAYFDVVQNPEKPFLIQTGEATVEVLGTSFNLKANPSENDIQLAVVEGRVSFGSSYSNPGKSSVILTEGQFAYMDLDQKTIRIEEFGVQNYLSWMRGRLVFDEYSLEQVCIQLNRLYQVQCGYTDNDLKDLTLTADFSNDSLEKTLSVISLSLDVNYEKDNGQVIWTAKEPGVEIEE